MYNLQAYLTHIGFEGIPRADLGTLETLQALHPARIPFENLDVLMDKTISLKLNQISHKLLAQTRGGYCFEHNSLLMAAMLEIGFEVEPMMARAAWQVPIDAPAGPRTHMVLRATIDGVPWLVDVGFGGLVPTAPLKLTNNLSQSTPHECFRIVNCKFGWSLEVEIDQQWHSLYHIGSEPQHPVDIEVANWYTSTHPQSKFRRNLIAARTTDDTRYTLLNNRLSIRKKGSNPSIQELSNEELIAALENYFLLKVKKEWRERLYHLIER